MRTNIVSLFLILMLAAGLTHAADTKITWWQFWTDPGIKPTLQSIVDQFEKENPGIKVELTDLTWANGREKIVIAFSSGMGPNIVELGSDWIAQFADAGQLADMSDLIKADSSQFQGWGMSTYEDHVYAFPWFLGTRVIYLNEALLKRTALGPDFIPYDTAGFRQAAFAIDSLGPNIYGFGSNTAEKHRLYKKFLPFFWSMGGQIFTEDGKYCVISSVQAVAALKYYQTLHDSCGFVGTQREIEDAFLDGKIGFIVSGDWLLKRMDLEKRQMDLILTNIPGPKFPGKSFMGGEFLAINKNSKNQEAAMKFIRFLTSPENQVKFCKANYSANPSSYKAQEDPYFANNEYLQAFIRQMRQGVHPPVDPDWVQIEDIIEEAVEQALFGDRLPATDLRNAQIKITELKRK